MMKLTDILTLVALVATPALALADGPPSDPCGTPVKKKKMKKRVPPPKPPVKEKDCDCVGREGPPGPPGPKGDPGDGITVRMVVVNEARTDSRISIAGGLMHSAHLPHGDWAWGPALQLRHTDRDRLQLSLAVGTASVADGYVGSESGWLAQLGLTKFDADGIGFGLGLHVTDIDGSPDNGNVDGRYIGLDGHLAVQRPVTDRLDLRLEFGPVISYLRDDVEGRQLGLGLQSSLFLGGDL